MNARDRNTGLSRRCGRFDTLLTDGRKGKGHEQVTHSRKHRWRGKIRGETKDGGYAESQGNSGLTVSLMRSRRGGLSQLFQSRSCPESQEDRQLSMVGLEIHRCTK